MAEARGFTGRFDKSEYKTRHEFIRSTLHTTPFNVWYQAFALLTSLGSLCDSLVQPTQFLPWSVGTVSLPWAAGIAVLATLLIYILGYRKAVHPLTMSIIGLMSAAAAFGLTIYFSKLSFDYHMTSH